MLIEFHNIGSIGVQPQTEPDQDCPSVTSRAVVLGVIEKLIERFNTD